MMPHIGPGELILILVIALIVFGPGKLPSVGAAVGKAFNEFKKASKELVGGGDSKAAEKDAHQNQTAAPAAIDAPASTESNAGK